MTHTEESLMALADEYNRCKGYGDRFERESREHLLLAIREVLAERSPMMKRDRDEWKAAANAAMELAMSNYERAEKAEAECERLRKNLYDAKGHADAYPGY